MRLKSIQFCLLACVALAAMSQPKQQTPEWEWYLDEVVSETFVGRNYFEYYYLPSAADMAQQREKGEVTYFLNSPEGLNSKKVRDMIDRLMASYDDIKATCDWRMTNATYWKEFRYEKNKFRFSVKRKALDDGTYYVSVTETADYYKSLGKKSTKGTTGKAASGKASTDKPVKRTSHERKKVVLPDDEEEDVPGEALAAALDGGDDVAEPVVSEKQRRREAREKKQADAMAERARQRRAQEQRRAEAQAEKEAKKQLKAEEKQKKEEEKRLKKEEEKRQREEARKEREQERRERAQERQEREAARKQAAAPKPVASKYHYTDVALWLSEKYDFTQTRADGESCTMYSTAVTDVEMAKLAIKNALKGSNARMAVPWRVNSETQAIETGYTVDGHVLVFAIGKDGDNQVTLTITEVSAEQFELFKQNN
jgi:hypothetical protein